MNKMQKVNYDKETKDWFENHIGQQTTVCMCDKCGLFYKTSLGHKCKMRVRSMAKYIEGDKVITTGEWNNGIDRTIPKGSIVRIISIAGKIEGTQHYNCIYQGGFALYEEGWLGEKINTNADRIRCMNDEELADFIRELNECCLAGAGIVDCSSNEDCIDCRGVVLEWLQSEAE